MKFYQIYNRKLLESYYYNKKKKANKTHDSKIKTKKNTETAS